MAIDDDIERQISDWIDFDAMLEDIAAANQVNVPRIQCWLHMKQFCYLRPFRFWYPHVEYQRHYQSDCGRNFFEGTLLVEFLLGADCFPVEKTLWALKNGGVARWQKSVVAEWLRAQNACAPNSWLDIVEPTRRVDATEQISEHWVSKAEILKHKWPLPLGDKVPPLERILDDLPQWVSDACKKTGRPGYGAGNSHLWNPAMLAICLMTSTSRKRWRSTKAALDRFIRNSYPDSIDEWERRSELL